MSIAREVIAEIANRSKAAEKLAIQEGNIGMAQIFRQQAQSFEQLLMPEIGKIHLEPSERVHP
jgi:hypothetical protein